MGALGWPGMHPRGSRGPIGPAVVMLVLPMLLGCAPSNADITDRVAHAAQRLEISTAVVYRGVGITIKDE
jgi:hypothetical protein